VPAGARRRVRAVRHPRSSRATALAGRRSASELATRSEHLKLVNALLRTLDATLPSTRTDASSWSDGFVAVIVPAAHPRRPRRPASSSLRLAPAVCCLGACPCERRAGCRAGQKAAPRQQALAERLDDDCAATRVVPLYLDVQTYADRPAAARSSPTAELRAATLRVTAASEPLSPAQLRGAGAPRREARIRWPLDGPPAAVTSCG